MSDLNSVLHAIVNKVGFDSEEEARAFHEIIDATTFSTAQAATTTEPTPAATTTEPTPAA